MSVCAGDLSRRTLTNTTVLIEHPVMVSLAKFELILTPRGNMYSSSEDVLAIGVLSAFHSLRSPWRFCE